VLETSRYLFLCLRAAVPSLLYLFWFSALLLFFARWLSLCQRNLAHTYLTGTPWWHRCWETGKGHQLQNNNKPLFPTIAMASARAFLVMQFKVLFHSLFYFFWLSSSLGGNCKTTMIATCAVDKKNIDVSELEKVWDLSSMFIIWYCLLQETISTCRFAQRVALVKNEAVLNEELDPKLVRWITQCFSLISMVWI